MRQPCLHTAMLATDYTQHAAQKVYIRNKRSISPCPAASHPTVQGLGVGSRIYGLENKFYLYLRVKHRAPVRQLHSYRGLIRWQHGVRLTPSGARVVRDLPIQRLLCIALPWQGGCLWSAAYSTELANWSESQCLQLHCMQFYGNHVLWRGGQVLGEVIADD